MSFTPGYKMQHRSSFGASLCPRSRGPRLTHFDIRFIYSNKNFLLVPASKLGRPTSLTRLVSSSKPLDFITKNSTLESLRIPLPNRAVDKKAPAYAGLSRTCRDHSPGNSFAVFLNFLTLFLAFFASSFSGVESRLNVLPPLDEHGKLFYGSIEDR